MMSLFSGYIKSNSMMLRGQVNLTGTGGGTGVWSFAGQSTNTAAAAADVVGGAGGAASLFSRFTLTLPGGAQVSYGQANYYRNAVIPHALSAEYFNDLRQLESAGLVKNYTTDVTTNKTCWFTTTVDIPCLNSQQSLPLLLMSGGLSLEIVTAAVNEAFYCIAGGATCNITTYEIKELALIYEVVQVTPEFKAGLVAAKAQSPYLIHCNDRLSLGPLTFGGTTRLNVGLGLSSMKGVVFTSMLVDSTSAVVDKPKVFTNNGMLNFAMYNNGQLFSIPTITSDDLCFSEMQRCLGRINDSNITSLLAPVVNTVTTNRRNNYNLGQFLAGSSCETIDDWSFSSQGVPCDQLALEITCGTQTADRWQGIVTAAASNLYIFVFYDSILVINPDGTCQIRK